MTLNASGSISLGGTSVGSSANIELGTSYGTTRSLGDSAVRSLSGVSSGAISMSSLYGKSSPISQVPYTAIGSEWTVPTGVYYISVVCVGSGAGGASTNGGGGGGLTWANGIPVSPGEILELTAPFITARNANGSEAYLKTSSGSYIISAPGGGVNGTGGQASSGYFTSNASNGAKYSGGNGGTSYGGGGGAAGYSGNGGNGGTGATYGSSGSGGGGGGGGGSTSAVYCGGGGGVGPVGEGGSGGGGASGGGGGGGSAGTSGGSGGILVTSGAGGGFGGGGGARSLSYGGTGGAGLVRIMWGANRYYPATNTGIL